MVANAHPCSGSVRHCDWTVQTQAASRHAAATGRNSEKRSSPSSWAHRFSLVSCWHWLSVEGFRKGSSSPQPCSFRTLLLKSRQHCEETHIREVSTMKIKVLFLNYSKWTVWKPKILQLLLHICIYFVWRTQKAANYFTVFIFYYFPLNFKGPYYAFLSLLTCKWCYKVRLPF